MTDNSIWIEKQLLGRADAAHVKELSLNQFKYHISKPGAPLTVFIGERKRPYYRRGDIEAWSPNLQPQKGRKK